MPVKYHMHVVDCKS